MIPTGQTQILGTSGSAGSLTVPPGNGTTLWAVNFNGPTRRRHIHDIRRRILRHLYATDTGVSTDNTALTVTKDYPVLPPTSPEAAITSTQSLPILADANNGTLFHDVDGKTHTTIHDFSTVASTIVGKYVRIAAR